jgi:hypothetical protein
VNTDKTNPHYQLVAYFFFVFGFAPAMSTYFFIQFTWYSITSREASDYVFRMAYRLKSAAIDKSSIKRFSSIFHTMVIYVHWIFFCGGLLPTIAYYELGQHMDKEYWELLAFCYAIMCFGCILPLFLVIAYMAYSVYQLTRGASIDLESEPGKAAKKVRNICDTCLSDSLIVYAIFSILISTIHDSTYSVLGT